MNGVPIVTVDGPSGSGKGTISQMLARHLGWHFLDSGAMYRVTGLAALRQGIPVERVLELSSLAEKLDVRFEENKIILQGDEVSDLIRTESAGNMASKVAAIPEVREALLARQRAFARPPGLVADGRDMGTVVFPRAGAKIFLTASAEERANRRYKQLKEKGFDGSLADLAEEIRERDARDRNRSTSPLRAAAAALEVESTGMSIQAVFDRVLQHVMEAYPQLRRDA
jgi:cytidylate kinase